MIIDDIIEILEADSELSTLLKPTVLDSKINPFDTNEGIAYKFIPLISNGIKTQARLEITCVNEDYHIATQILERVKKILITIGDDRLTNRIKNVSLSGGGSIKDIDTELYLIKGFFIITFKE